jgi:hypothetical protein
LIVVAITAIDLSRREERAIEEHLRLGQQSFVLGQAAPVGIVDGIRINARALSPKLDQQKGSHREDDRTQAPVSHCAIHRVAPSGKSATAVGHSASVARRELLPCAE